MTHGQIALACSAALFVLCLAVAGVSAWRRRAAAVPAASPRFVSPAMPAVAAAPDRHPVLVAADWVRDERRRRAAARLIDRVVDDGVDDELERLMGAFVPKDGGGPA
ncbi:MAG: hypothetical protein BGO49_04430 [Planctomycetales bacterium 71-10]|nr:MAG: hypothetical protein BGO49_04430 [Planctomycetales bacterium 71-10]